MEQSQIRALILEEIQGIIKQVSEESEGINSPLSAAAKSIGEVITKRLDSVKAGQETANESDQDTEIGKDSV